MAGRSDYAEVVAQAEKAVAAVKDPELKRIAFQKVLDDLLGIGSEPSTRATTSPRGRKAQKSASAAAPRKSRRGGPIAYVRELVEEGFFKKPKTIANVKAELENRGHHIPITSLSGPLQRLCQQKVLRRNKSKGEIFTYSNW